MPHEIIALLANGRRFIAIQLSCLQSRSLQALAATYQNIPAIVDSTAPGSQIANVYGINVPKSWNMNNPVLDGKTIREEPLKVGPQVPIIAGASESN